MPNNLMKSAADAPNPALAMMSERSTEACNQEFLGYGCSVGRSGWLPYVIVA